MNKIQTSIYITANDVKVENNKIIVINGEFYFQGTKYLIHDKKIYHDITETEKGNKKWKK